MPGMRVTTKTLIGSHPEKGKSKGQRLRPRIHTFTVAETSAHVVISDMSTDYQCGFIGRCDGRTNRKNGRCPRHSGGVGRPMLTSRDTLPYESLPVPESRQRQSRRSK